MTRFRNLFFWIHLVAGVAAGVVILVLSVTGAALALKPQILRIIDTAGFRISADGRQPLSASALVDTIHRANPGADVRSVTIQRDATTPATAQIGSSSAYVDPYSGTVLGQTSQTAQQLFRSIENWHRWFALQGDSRQTGRAITGLANAVFLFLALTGLYLWMPRQWTLRHLRPITLFRRTATPKARDFNWHNVAGIWSLPMIVVMTLTGVFMSYPSLTSQLQRTLGGTVTMERGGGPERGRGDEGGGAVRVVAAVIEAAVAELQSREPAWQSISLEMPRTAAGTMAVSASTGGSTPAKRSQLAVDAHTGEVVRWQAATTAAPLAQRVRTWIRFGHTGELWGVTGQVLAGLSCLGGVLLVWSGVSLAVRRLTTFIGRSAASGARHAAAA